MNQWIGYKLLRFHEYIDETYPQSTICAVYYHYDMYPVWPALFGTETKV